MDALVQNLTWFVIGGLVAAVIGFLLFSTGIFANEKSNRFTKIVLGLLGLILSVSGLFTFFSSIQAAERMRTNKSLSPGIHQSIDYPEYYVFKDMSDVLYYVESDQGEFTLTDNEGQTKKVKLANGLVELFRIKDLKADTTEKLEGTIDMVNS